MQNFRKLICVFQATFIDKGLEKYVRLLLRDLSTIYNQENLNELLDKYITAFLFARPVVS